MKKIFISIILIISIILSACSGRKIALLELKNKELQHSVDSLVDLNKSLQIQIEHERLLADNAAVEARRSAEEAVRQHKIASKLKKQN
jgi:hypothetical protein